MVLRGKPRGRVGRCRIFFDVPMAGVPLRDTGHWLFWPFGAFGVSVAQGRPQPTGIFFGDTLSPAACRTRRSCSLTGCGLALRRRQHRQHHTDQQQRQNIAHR
jgi:hypothetical protein